jgi:hypothetical protein
MTAKAEHVFPEEGGREEVLAEDDLFPDRAGHHDGQQDERLDNDGNRGRVVARTGPHEPQDQPSDTRKTRNCSGARTP